MSSITEDLFLAVSNSIGVRVTPENLRSQMQSASSVGGMTGAVKTDILQELLIAFAKLEKKIDENRPGEE